MEEKLNEIQDILNWYTSNVDSLEPLDAIKGMEATIFFANMLKPLYEKYNEVEKEGFKILARLTND